MAGSAVIGALRVNLGLDSAQFQNGLRQNERRVAKAGQRMKGVMLGAFGGLLTGAALNQMRRSVDRAVDTLDDIAKSADKIGVTTDALQELRVAADLSGVSTSQLDTALSRFARTASDARNGLSTAERAFDAVGVSVTDLDGNLKPIDALLSEVADGMAGMGDATQRAATAQELFGRSGTQMVNLLAAGGAGIEQMRQQARELGIVFEEGLIRETVRLKDEMTLLQKQLDADLTKAFVRAGPLVRDFGNLLVWLANRAADAHEGFRRLFAGELFRSGEDAVTERLVRARAELADIQGQIENLTSGRPASTGSALAQGPGGIASAIENRVDPKEDPEAAFALLERLQNKAAEAEAEVRSLEAALTALGGGAEDVIAPEPVVTAPSLPTADDKKRAEEIRQTREELERLIEAERVQREIIGANIATLGAEEGARERLLAQLHLERVEKEVAALASQDLNEAQREELERLRELLPVLRQVTLARVDDELALRQEEEAIFAAERAQRELAASISMAGDELVRAIDQGGSWIDVLQSIIQELLRLESVQKALFGAKASGGGSGGGGLFGTLATALGGAIGGLFGGGAGSGVTTAANNPIRGASASLFTSSGAVVLPPLGSFAHGANFTVGGLGGIDRNLVAMRLSRGEQVDITPAHEVGRGAGAQIGNITMNFPNVRDRQTAREAGGSMKRRLAEVVGEGGGYR